MDDALSPNHYQCVGHWLPVPDKYAFHATDGETDGQWHHINTQLSEYVRLHVVGVVWKGDWINFFWCKGNYSATSNEVGTLAVDGWAVTFGTVRRGLGGLGSRPVFSCFNLTVPNVTAHPSTASVPTSYYLMWHYNCLQTLRGLNYML